jgi:hypothetical protein
MNDSVFIYYILFPALIFLARMADVTLGTLRIIMVSRGLKNIAPIVGFFEVIIWLLAIRQIMMNLTEVSYFLAYASGFAAGNYVGMWFEEVKPQEGEFIIPKRRFSAFFGTELDLLLREKKVEKVEIVGVLTNICVLYTAAWAQMLHYQVAAYRQGLTSNDLQAHEFALKEMKNTLGIEIL